MKTMKMNMKKMRKKDNKNFHRQCKNDTCTIINVFLFKLIEETKTFNEDEIKRLKQTFYYL